MPVEMLTYADLGERLKISPEAARALVKRHRWPRSRSNDGKTLVQVDLTEISHSPISRSPQPQAGKQLISALKQKIENLQAELLEAKTVASGIGPTSRGNVSVPTSCWPNCSRPPRKASAPGKGRLCSKASYRCCRNAV